MITHLSTPMPKKEMFLLHAQKYLREMLSSTSPTETTLAMITSTSCQYARKSEKISNPKNKTTQSH